ncbi:MAG: M20 family peptidase [Deltaproteobacteria bacterium]|nr:MAG: M20 family peptidase [Deltaproteobacteria bacterium]
MSGGGTEVERALDAAVDEAFEARQVPFFARLVETPSHTHAKDDVEVAARMVEAFGEGLGLSVERHADPEGRFADHRVFASPAAGADEPALLLVGHVDTVFPRSMGFLHFRRGEGEASDLVYGPGTLDMKSGLSCMLFALDAVARVVPDFLSTFPLRMLCNTDEEVGSPSSAPLVRRLAAVTTRALVFEGGREGDRIITRRKGGGTFVVDVEGVSAHAGNEHDKGVNAIVALSYVIPVIASWTDYDAGTTINVGLVEGGTAKNTVPDKARCVVDARFVTMEEARRIERKFAEWVADPFAGLDVPDRLRRATFRLRGGITRPPMEATEATQRLRLDYEACAAAVGLGVGEAPLQGGGSDANLLAAEGVAVIDGLGPYGRFFHNPREFSSLSSLRKRTKALARFLVSERLRHRS